MDVPLALIDIKIRTGFKGNKKNPQRPTERLTL